jgi:hypothetical protein
MEEILALKSKLNAPKIEKSKLNGSDETPPEKSSGKKETKLELKNSPPVIKIDLVMKTKIQLLLRAIFRKKRSIFNADMWDLAKDVQEVFK